MRYLSVCSGIEAASVAWHDMGWQPVAFSEIEPFPSAVLKHRFPHVPNWGDMTKFQSWPDATINLLVGGTPCQSFSVAGLRQGLKDPRGNLMLTFLAIAERYKPKWIVWENVPGVLSSNGGKDFGSFLAALGELGYGWAYRVLDAQWFGVAQRRRRVFVVGCLGDQRSAAKVLFESESVSRHLAPSREKRQAAAGSTEEGFGGGSQWMSPNGAETVGTLRARDYKGPSTDSIHEGRGLAISAWWNGDQTASTVTTRSGGQYMPDKDNFGAVLTPTVIDRAAFNQGENAKYDIKIEESQTMPSLVAQGPHAVTIIDRAAMNAGYDLDRDPGIYDSQTMPTLTAQGPHGVAQPISIQDVTTRDKAQNGKGWNDDGTAYTIDTHATQGVAQPISWDSECNANVNLMGTIVRGGQGGRTDGVMQPISIQGNLVGRDSGGPQGVGASVDGTMYTLTKSDVHAVAHAFKIRGGSPTETGEYGGTPGKAAGKGYLGSDELAFTIAATQDQQIFYRKSRRAKSADDFETWKRDFVTNTLNCWDTGDIRATDVVLTSFGFLPTQGSRAHGLGIEKELSPTLRSGCDAYGVWQEAQAVDVYNQSIDGNVAATVTEAVGGSNTSGPKVMTSPIAFDAYNQTINENTSQTIGSSASDVNHYGAVMMPNVSPTITQCKGSRGGSSMEAIDEIKAIYAQQPMAIRRLTPLECERLQGFPELKKITTFTLWLDHQNNYVNVEIKCRSERINAYYVEGKEKQENALSAQENFSKNQVKNKNVAGLNVQLNYEPRVVEQHNLKKSFSNVLSAEQKNLFLQLIQQENFAHQIVVINTTLEKEVQNGKGALQLNTMHFTQENNGRLHALLFGQEKEVSVNDVENTIKEITTYITSNLGQNIQNLNTNYQTWLCFVLNVIALFTHEKINQKISFEISNQVGWTQIPWKNKPAEECPDGPRYKACGNSMAVPCMRWIGQRINDAKTEIF